MRKCIQRGITIESLGVPEKYCRVCYAMLNAIIGRKWFLDAQMSFEAETLAGIACSPHYWETTGHVSSAGDPCPKFSEGKQSVQGCARLSEQERHSIRTARSPDKKKTAVDEGPFSFRR